VPLAVTVAVGSLHEALVGVLNRYRTVSKLDDASNTLSTSSVSTMTRAHGIDFRRTVKYLSFVSISAPDA
jgi:hypothetical protein